ncbi:MAG TPA: TIGR04551 family protein, partial [Polyangiaceae bacterium]|nr:TIGR04551 family protein [Polyangiaceae bacterium]
WGEYATPVGQLRFGRMPNHWGLGILENSGDTYDSDWQSTVDRIMFTTGFRSLDLYISGAWDFPNEGPTSATLESTIGGQPYDLAQLDDVNQYTAMVARRRNPELAKLDLARGDVVVNGGAYFRYRDQLIASENVPIGTPSGDVSTKIVRRGLKLYTPDVWFQLLYKKFRFEMEGVMVAGSLQSTEALGGGESATIRSFGLATQTEWKAVEDRLRLQFGFGWSSGDSGLNPDDASRNSSLSPSRAGTSLSPRVIGNRTYSQFRFHPDYRVDLIFHRQLLSRVQGDYYFRPSIEYDFTRNAEGQKLGGGAAIIWSRASEFVQTPGHKRDLGIELNLGVYYQSKDGSLNDNPDKMGGFFTSLQYGVFFPMGGLGYLANEAPPTPETSAAHTLRWFMGILF